MFLHSAGLLRFNAPGDWAHLPDTSQTVVFESFFTVTKQWKWLFRDLTEKHLGCFLHPLLIPDTVLVFFLQSNWLLSVFMSSSSAQICSEGYLPKPVLFWSQNLRTAFYHSPALAALPVPHVFTCLQRPLSSATLFPVSWESSSRFPSGWRRTETALVSLELLFLLFSPDVPARKWQSKSADDLWALVLLWGSKKSFQRDFWSGNRMVCAPAKQFP